MLESKGKTAGFYWQMAPMTTSAAAEPRRANARLPCPAAATVRYGVYLEMLAWRRLARERGHAPNALECPLAAE
jgi:hypothetical protein